MPNFYSNYWWIFLLRGIFALVLGILAIVWPGATFTTLVVFFGAYLFIAGTFAVIGAIAARRTSENWGVFLLTGIVGIILGILTIINPFATGAALIYLVAFWAVVAGLFEIIIAIRLRKVITGEGWYIAGGLLTIFFGILLLSNPVAAAVTLTWIFGFYAIITGVMLISLSFRLRKR
ncbi:HdeD family acid-resistance protein [Chitinophaga sp. CB10]|uniref:HdeD family acid-resistance protein n=1 Tax=Chitinophaga sp. CB10 TaxID=1891659 RepID=UPI0025BDA5C0|nr:HdeD family acid-resistance protein [Chitinophaga sp. CB10]